MELEALYRIRAAIKREIDAIVNEPIAVWRAREATGYDRLNASLMQIEQDIISVELEDIDPIQKAEMMAEMGATGNYNDDLNLYFLTPLQEEKFQEGIQRQIEFGYYDEGGQYVEGTNGYYVERCSCRGYVELDYEFPGGVFLCHDCSNEALGFMKFLGYLGNQRVVESDYGYVLEFAGG